MASDDVRDRFYWLLRASLLAAFIGAAIYGIVLVGELLVARANQVRCEANLHRIGEALFLYKSKNNNRLPPYLTLLYPDYLSDASLLICPADRNNGKQGAFPPWARLDKAGKTPDDWRDELAFTDLDGPTLLPWDDKDTIPCSYLYRFNEYPCDTSEEGLKKGITWRQLAEDDQRTYRNKTPVVTCFWHLPNYPKNTDGITTNLLYDLATVVGYPKDWRTEMGEAGK